MPACRRGRFPLPRLPLWRGRPCPRLPNGGHGGPPHIGRSRQRKRTQPRVSPKSSCKCAAAAPAGGCGRSVRAVRRRWRRHSPSGSVRSARDNRRNGFGPCPEGLVKKLIGHLVEAISIRIEAGVPPGAVAATATGQACPAVAVAETACGGTPPATTNDDEPGRKRPIDMRETETLSVRGAC